mgnify:CR=1 FL=1|jgi:hypothetical protein|tara:strand:+ start:73 stop:210 length:138 start_codon:yes stop_codon:yes gene_type:complete
MERKVEKKLITGMVQKTGNGLIGFGMDRREEKALTMNKNVRRYYD